MKKWTGVSSLLILLLFFYKPDSVSAASFVVSPEKDAHSKWRKNIWIGIERYVLKIRCRHISLLYELKNETIVVRTVCRAARFMFQDESLWYLRRCDLLLWSWMDYDTRTNDLFTL